MYKIYMVYRDFMVLNYTIIQDFIFSRVFISQIQDCVAPIIEHGLRLFILQEVRCLKHDDALYSGTASLYQVSCLNMLPLVSYAFNFQVEEVVSEDEPFTKYIFP